MLQQNLDNRSPKFWFIDIGTAALIAFVAATLSTLQSTWNLTPTITANLAKLPRWRGWTIPVVIILFLFTAILPVFYFALYRNEGTLRFPKRMRWPALAAAFTSSVILAVALAKWFGGFGARADASVFSPPRNLWAIGDLLALFADLSFVLLMIAFFRQATGEPGTDVSASWLLRRATKTAVIGWGVWVSFLTIRLAFTPHTHLELTKYALQFGRTAPSLGSMFADSLSRLLTEATLFAAPYIVWKSSLRK